MKMDLLNAKLALAAVAAATLLTGCASDRAYSNVSNPSNALAFTTVTDPNQLVKWTGDRYLQMSLRSMDTYYFQVPDTGYAPGAVPAGVGTAGAVVVDSGTGEVTVPDTTVTPGPYQSRSGAYKVIAYRPGHAN